jgi:hypothetical protein
VLIINYKWYGTQNFKIIGGLFFCEFPGNFELINRLVYKVWREGMMIKKRKAKECKEMGGQSSGVIP